MPWLLASPGHQQPRYWLRKVGMFLSLLPEGKMITLHHFNISARYHHKIYCVIFFLHNQQIECWNQYLDYMIWNLIRTCRLKEHTMLENSRSCPNRIISMCAGRLLRTICLADHQDGTARWHMGTGKPARWRDDIRHAGCDAANPMLSTMLWVPDS